ncbi:c-type cytochrome [Solimonas terrae]|uniref:C-type cytochrome n=1 Tax=Solimonas terrae TaxID=1396819 RepID=A0A6M2BS83_9GAMM|nr:c-type cytochrome [Solimonas terrae]NGY05190.1 c-type cytochrome [Solimonas terrae]
MIPRCAWHLALLLLLACPGLCVADDAAPAPEPLDSMHQRVLPCMACHGDQGRATNDGYYPRIAGKPAGYLYNQLLNFRDGRRRYPMMTYLVERQNDAYLHELARYFADRHAPYPPPQQPEADAAVLARGATLVRDGDASLKVPACRSCHGERLTGVLPATPGLLGLSHDYLLGQLGAWRIGGRHAQAPDCMHEIVLRLTPTDLYAVTDWLSSQAVPADPLPATTLPTPMPMVCGSVPTLAEAAE